MIYPVWYLDESKEQNNIYLLDTDEPEYNPYMKFSYNKEDAPLAFIKLLLFMLDSNFEGYLKGYDEGWEDCTIEYDIEEDEDEYGDIDFK